MRALRKQHGVLPVYKRVDTCGAEFEAHTPYLYSTYEDESEARPTNAKKIMILGGGPNRIGQGIEFDYCCVHAAFALSDAGFETIMVNCNPETVSTDYDTSDRLYFEPLTLEDVLAIVDKEQPFGVIVQFGGQTPLKLAVALEKAGVPILGTPPDAIDRAEDRERFDLVLDQLAAEAPALGHGAQLRRGARGGANASATRCWCARATCSAAARWRSCTTRRASRGYMQYAVQASPEHPVLVDRFLNDATEVDVDAISDGERVVIGGVMEHIEEAGIHSGDSACSLPPYSLVEDGRGRDRRVHASARARARCDRPDERAVRREGQRRVRARGESARVAHRAVRREGDRPPAREARGAGHGGKTLAELGFTEEIWPKHFSVKEAVFPFVKFPGVDTVLGPEMKSTGEVMGIDSDFGRAYAKAQIEAGNPIPTERHARSSPCARATGARVGEAVREFVDAGFKVLATDGTAQGAARRSASRSRWCRRWERARRTSSSASRAATCTSCSTRSSPTPSAVRDSFSIRRAALNRGVPYFTTLAGLRAAAGAIRALRKGTIGVRALQEVHAAR